MHPTDLQRGSAVRAERLHARCSHARAVADLYESPGDMPHASRCDSSANRRTASFPNSPAPSGATAPVDLSDHAGLGRELRPGALTAAPARPGSAQSHHACPKCRQAMRLWALEWKKARTGVRARAWLTIAIDFRDSCSHRR